MSNNAKRQQAAKIVRERLLWLVKPLGFTAILVWCLHPDTVRPEHVEQNLTVGFLLGALYSVYLRREALLYYLGLRGLIKYNRKNRVPAEFCLGRTLGVVVAEGQKEVEIPQAKTSAAVAAAGGAVAAEDSHKEDFDLEEDQESGAVEREGSWYEEEQKK